MPVKGYEGARQPQSAPTSRPATAPEAQKAPQAASPTRTFEPTLAPRTVPIPTAAKTSAPAKEAYAERLMRLAHKESPEQQSALEVAEEAVAELQAVAEAQGLKASDVTVLLSVDISGEESIKCAYCGRPTCSYRPTKFRVKNPDIDLLGDTLTAFQEKMAEAGFKYGFILYDDQNVLVLREPDVAKDQAERATTIDRYAAFRDRIQYPDPNSQGWMQEMLNKWKPSFATTTQARSALDGPMFDVGFRLLGAAGGAVRSMTVAKSLPPTDGTAGIAARAQAEGIPLSAIAIGKRAAEVAKKLSFPSTQVSDFHGLRDQMGQWVKALADQIAKMP